MNIKNTFTTRRTLLFKSTLRTAAVVAALTLTIGLGILSPLQVSARREATNPNVSDVNKLEEAAFEDPVRPSRGDRRGRGDTQPALPVVRTRLDGRIYSGGDLDSSSPWEKAVTPSSAVKVTYKKSGGQPAPTLMKSPRPTSPRSRPTSSSASSERRPVCLANSVGGPVEEPQNVLKNAFNATQW